MALKELEAREDTLAVNISNITIHGLIRQENSGAFQFGTVATLAKGYVYCQTLVLPLD